MALGIRRTKLTLITVATQNALPVRQLKLLNLATFWNTNLERAIFARRIARLMRVDEELVFAASLLQDFLLPVLTRSCGRCVASPVYFLFEQDYDGSQLDEGEEVLSLFLVASGDSAVMLQL